ncbi:MAG: glycosyltransferase family 2 protein [Pseudomonadota bacterium]
MPSPKIYVIIPALNEAKSIAGVVSAMVPRVDGVIVVDNGSTDATPHQAAGAGAQVVTVPNPGYGRACLAGITHLCTDDTSGGPIANDDDIIVFMDGDAADDPNDLPRLLCPLQAGTADFVVGSRLNSAVTSPGEPAPVEAGALTLPQQVGNRLACALMWAFWGGPFTDLGPFRAIRVGALNALNLDAQTYGWTVQMQARALKHHLRVAEVPVRYRRRVGQSKISGTVKGVAFAGFYILSVIGLEAIRPLAPQSV